MIIITALFRCISTDNFCKLSILDSERSLKLQSPERSATSWANFAVWLPFQALVPIARRMNVVTIGWQNSSNFLLYRQFSARPLLKLQWLPSLSHRCPKPYVAVTWLVHPYVEETSQPFENNIVIRWPVSNWLRQSFLGAEFFFANLQMRRVQLLTLSCLAMISPSFEYVIARFNESVR